MDEMKLVRYEAMLAAIAECHHVDETLQIREQAAALEAAARIAMNTEAERKAIDIRVRAERRAGELLAVMDRQPGARTDKPAASVAGGSEYREKLQRNKIPERTARRWQELARVPPDEFEERLASEMKPSVRAILNAERDTAPSPVPDEALWIWGRLLDFERMGLIDCDPQFLLEQMTQPMRDDVERLSPLVVVWLNRVLEKEIV